MQHAGQRHARRREDRAGTRAEAQPGAAQRTLVARRNRATHRQAGRRDVQQEIESDERDQLGVVARAQQPQRDDREQEIAAARAELAGDDHDLLGHDPTTGQGDAGGADERRILGGDGHASPP